MKLITDKTILDPCCGGKMFWFDKNNPDVFFGDIRKEEHDLCDGRHFSIDPDHQIDFTNLPFPDNHFRVVVFDPPHLERGGPKSWMAKKYGKLNKETWPQDIKDGFSECFRVLMPYGVLIFKWNEVHVPVSRVLSLAEESPLFGHRVGKHNNTHWLTFMKSPDD